ncbi:hypothetical protein [Flavobacterium sp. N2270]|uniref:hypothetical protein n=1 Tax=Flavobacterium sp. N2270 TaxID=2986831 RepID=UPI002224D963|nr:hypothetical protein [Flavobacterium sp. N2270]
MKKQLLVLFSLLFSITFFAQVGIGTTNILNGVELQIESSSRGLLIPRVALTSTIIQAPVGPAPIATGVLVYNTNINGVGATAVSPGFYYWSGTEWVALKSNTGTPSLQNWSLLGNAGTTPGTNYLGTSDNRDLQFKTNNQLRMTTKNSGEVIIGNSTNPLGNTLTTIFPTGTQIGLFAYSDNSPRTIRALNVDNTQFVIDGGNLDADGGRGVIGISANLASSSTNTVMGVLGVAGRTTFTELPGESVGVSGQGTTGLHVRGVGKTGSNDYYSAYFEYDQDDNLSTSNGPQARIAGKDFDYFGGGAARRDVTYGGYFDANTSNSDYVFVGARNNNTSYKVLGGGSVSTMVKDDDGNNRILHATETPEILFEDFGTGKLINGVAYIDLDPIFSKNIFVSQEHPMKVFIQLEGDCKGVYVTEKTAKGFLVKELQNGNSNVSFSWNVVANRKDTLKEDGSIDSEHVGVRFPIGPNRLKPVLGREVKYDIKE